MIEPEVPATPELPATAGDPDDDPAGGLDGDVSTGAGVPPSRQVLFVVGGGMILVLVAALGAAALLSTGDTSRPHATSAAADPIVLSPSVDPGSEPASGPASEPAGGPPVGSASPQPGPTPTRAGPTRTPTVQKTTAAPPPVGSQVTSARITVSPDSKQGICDPGNDLVYVHVTITVSQPGVRLRFSVNGGGEHGGIAQSKTYTESWPISVPHTAGDHRIGLKVTAPSSATDTAIYRFTCIGH
ncbi:hypothetical protein ACFPIJ_58730 [Dactylosporangium cerinum]|uniref:Uncharacterized protein n=1 Tax=Dactylosporangium cerinum TaxID=1434730 RepID=A0ABV9WFU3_9ACTN